MGNREEALLLLAGQLYLGTSQDEEALTFLRPSPDWTSLLKKAEAEGMSGLLAFQLKRLARVLPIDLPLPNLTHALHTISAQNMTLFSGLVQFCELLKTLGLQAILLKGGALIETVYRGHLGLRPLSDLDLLVRTRDLPAIAERLKGQGFRPLSSSFLVNGSARFDLHTDLVGTARIRRRGLAFHFDQEILWQKAMPLHPQDPTLFVLSPPYQALHLAVHALKHSFSRLIWFVDLGLVLQRVKWEELLDQAEATGTFRPLAYALWGLKELMGVELPREVLTQLPPLNWLERRFLQGVVSREAMGALGEVLVACSIPGLTAKLGYLLEVGFPRQEVLAEVFPSTPSWLLYPRRLLQLLALGVQEGRPLVTPVKRRNGR